MDGISIKLKLTPRKGQQKSIIGYESFRKSAAIGDPGIFDQYLGK